MKNIVLDFNEWASKELKKTVFCVRLRKDNYTPLEVEQKYMDEDHYTLVHEYAKVEKIIELPSGTDCLIGFREMWIHTDIIYKEYHSYIQKSDKVCYYRLSQILFDDVTKTWKEECRTEGVNGN